MSDTNKSKFPTRKINSRFDSGNACHHSAQNLLSFSFLHKNINIKIQRTATLPIVWYGWETRSLTLKEGQRLRVFEDRLLRKIRGSKALDVTGGWRKLQNKKFYGLYTSPKHFLVTISRSMKWAEHKTHMEEKRNACGVLVGKPEGQRPLRRPTCRLVNTQKYLKKKRDELLAQERNSRFCGQGYEHLGSRKYWELLH